MFLAEWLRCPAAYQAQTGTFFRAVHLLIFAMQAMNIYVVFQYKEDTSQCDNMR